MPGKRAPDRSVGLEELKELRREEEDPKVRDRIMAVIMRAQDYGNREIAKLLGTTRSTVWRWTKWFDEDGVEGLRDEHGSGKPPKMSERDRERLKEDLRGSPRDFGYEEDDWSTEIAMDHIREKYGVDYHHQYVLRFLRSQGFKKSVRRSRERLYFDMLEAISEEAKLISDVADETRQQAVRTSEHMKKLLEAGLAEECDDAYATTDRGMEYMEKYRELLELLGSES